MKSSTDGWLNFENPHEQAKGVILHSSLAEAEIPDSVAAIGNSAFSGCASLQQIRIPPSVAEIGEEAFYGCSSVAEISVPASVAKIGKKAFGKCSSLEEAAIPSSVSQRSIGVGSKKVRVIKI